MSENIKPDNANVGENINNTVADKTPNIAPNSEINIETKLDPKLADIFKAIENMPNGKEALAEYVKTINPAPAPPVEEGPPIEYAPPLDLEKASLTEFVNYKSNTTDPSQELKMQLMGRYKMSGSDADEVVRRAENELKTEHSITKRFPLDYVGSLRTKAIAHTERIVEEVKQAEDYRIGLIVEHQRLAEREFGYNYAAEMSKQAEEYYMDAEGVDLDDIKEMKPEKYAKLLTRFNRVSRKGLPEINKESSAQKAEEQRAKTAVDNLKKLGLLSV